MDLVDRVKNILLKPAETWPVIETEAASVQSLYKDYLLLLALIPPLATLIGYSVFGLQVPVVGTVRVSLLSGLGAAITSYVLSLAAIYVLSLVINALAPTFGGQADALKALKLAAYASTPAFVAGALHLLPSLSALAALASLYGIYLLYLGLPRLMRCDADKTLPYTAVVVLAGIVLVMVIGAFGGLASGGAQVAGR